MCPHCFCESPDDDDDEECGCDCHEATVLLRPLDRTFDADELGIDPEEGLDYA